jgi:pimeloyl-ACP methyl ester carboxylesterase
MEKIPVQFLEVEDVKIAYREYGSGLNLILLHGNSGRKEMFSKYQLEYFKDFHTIALDSRGHGQTVSQDTRLSIEQISLDVIGFCRARGIRRAYVIGYSDGGNIALFLAKKEPGLFPRIVAISPNYLVSGTTDDSLRMIRRFASLFRALGRLGLPTRKALMRFELMLDDIGLTDKDLRSIRTGLQILYAEHDMIKEDHILEMGSLIPGATVRKIAGCSHLTIVSRQAAIQAMREYLLAG